MSINNLKLTSLLLKNLYPDVLTEDLTKVPKLKQTAKKEIKKYLGDNSRNILVISSFENAIHIPDEQLEFLTTVLSACKLSLADVAIYNLFGKDDFSAEQLLEELRPKAVLLFGVQPDELDLPVRFPVFQKQLLKNVIYLASPRLEELKSNKDLKARLWVCLKNIFNL